MKIGINASIIDPYRSGLGVFSANLVREISLYYENIVIYASCPDFCEVSLSKIRKAPNWTQPRYGRIGHLMRMLWLQAVFPFKLRKDCPDILFSPISEGLIWSIIPQVVVVHDIIPVHFRSAHPLQYYYFKYFLPIILKNSKRIISVSHRTKMDLQEFYGIREGKIQVVWNGVDKNRFRFGLDYSISKKKYDLGSYVLYVGNLHPHKNLCWLIEAFNQISKRKPKVDLVIVGKKDPRFYPDLVTQAKNYDLLGRVRFLDYLPMDDLPGLYAGAEVVVHPSRYEGFGLTVLEAMACGTPVIATRVGGIPEVAGEAAILVDLNDTSELVEAIQRVLEDELLRCEMRNKGLAQAKKFDWQQSARKVLEIIQAP